jgi:CBS domain containing-hemolysin-like protein
MDAALFFTFVAGALFAFVFAGLEAGFFALNHLRIRQQMRAGNRRAALLHSYIASPERYLRTILAGNAVSLVTMVLSGFALLQRWLSGPNWLLLTASIAAIWFAFICRLLPRVLFRAYPNRLSISFAPVFRLCERLLWPLAWVAQTLTDLITSSAARHIGGHVYGSRDELRLTMHETPGLTPDERAMIHRVLDLQDLTVQQISVPISKVTAVNADTPVARILEIYKERGLSRMPVWKQNGANRIIGIVDLNSILFDEIIDERKTAAEYVSVCPRFAAGTRLEIALRELQRTNQRLGVVLDRHGAESGIVSLQDILKVIFGEVAL